MQANDIPSAEGYVPCVDEQISKARRVDVSKKGEKEPSQPIPYHYKISA